MFCRSDENLKMVVMDKQKTRLCAGDTIRLKFRQPKGWLLDVEKHDHGHCLGRGMQTNLSPG